MPLLAPEGSIMAGGRETGAAPPGRSDEDLEPLLNDPYVLAWFGEHAAELRRAAFGQRILYGSLASVVVVGLAAHAVGYLLRSISPAEPYGLLADMLYGLGYSLWTAAVVVVFVQLYPEAKRRQVKRALDAYEATVRKKTRSEDAGNPAAR
jgi:hypothetical protein